MHITHLFRKTLPERTIEPCTSLELLAEQGILGDASAQVGSPRQVLLIDRPSLDRYGLQPGDLWENIVVEGDISQWRSGQVLQVGQTGQLRLTFLCEPCATLERLQAGLTKRIKGQRGMLGLVVQGGSIHLGDALNLTDVQYPPLPETAKARFTEFAARIPPGQVVRTSDVILALGLANAYYRSIPTFLKKAVRGLPVHRIVSINGNLMTKYVPDQREQLAAEGVLLIDDRVPPCYYWSPDQFHPIHSISKK